MTIDSLLVTVSEPIQADVTAGVAAVRSSGRLPGCTVLGSWADDASTTLLETDGTGTVSNDVDRFVLRVSRPQRTARAALAELGTDLLARLPSDVDPLWVTELALETPGDPERLEAHYAAVTAWAQPVLERHPGALVLTSGGNPRKALSAGLAAVPAVGAVVFVGAVLTPSEDDPTWSTALAALATLCRPMPALYPDHLLVDGEWAPLGDDDVAPQWWPMSQSAYAAAGRFAWAVDGSEGGPGRVVHTLEGHGLQPPQASAVLVEGLRDLAQGPVDYAYAHPWQPDEPWTGALGPRMSSGQPWFMLSERQLALGLPTLSWLQVLGPRWVDRFGRDQIATLPAYRVTEVATDRWLVQLTADLESVVDDYAAFAAVREAAVAHLGAEHFPHR